MDQSDHSDHSSDHVSSELSSPSETARAVRQDLQPAQKATPQTLKTFWAFRFTGSKISSDGGNPTEEDDMIFLEWLDTCEFIEGFAYQLEEGTGKGKIQHYQGTLKVKPRKKQDCMHRWALERWPKLEFPYKDYLRPTKSAAHNEYSVKKDTRVRGPWVKGEPFNKLNIKKKISLEIEESDLLPYDEMFLWGQELEDMVKGCLPDKKCRKIFWYWSKEGEMKKTETARRLVYFHDALVIQGGRKHILANAYKNPCPIYVLLIPRTDEGYVSYASIELLKDSLYMSNFGTEATGSINRKKPWIICFANFPPPEHGAISRDRWVITNVDV